ncbi:MAG: cytochrome D ubiquinol oxidase subunit I [Candidatus Eremiobacteraeota bacterium]|nr:cytochrome D ubiquinol oxidase subunit I [Candidatus Eremiobacteraeota bacterium]
MVEYLQTVRERPAWQPVPQEVKDALRQPLSAHGMPLRAVYDEFARLILPYPTGNISPRFFGWVHGSGTPAGALADFLASSMNANVGGRDHVAVYVERQVIKWFCELFQLGEGASGILLSGTSLANFVAVLVARTAQLGYGVRERGLDQHSERLVGYASAATHSCVRKAFEMAGIGSEALRVLPIDERHRVDVDALEAAIERDSADGLRPFLIVGNAGTVDVGAFDPLNDLAAIAKTRGIWFHVDGAFGAITILSQRLRSLAEGIEGADSIAFDFHKWLHVPYDAACVLIRDGEMHRATFASEGPYITRMQRGLAAGDPWFADYGPDLSRSFRALKIWFTLKHFGTRRLAEAIERNCEQAQLLAQLIESSADFELAAPVALNVVCFRYRDASDANNDEIAIRVQLSGRAVISATTVEGRRALRACFTNQRTTERDVHELFAAVKDATA